MEALERRPLQCFRCLEKRHTRAQCGGGPDRSKRCYQCGEPGHAAKDCRAPARCPVCADLGQSANYRAGSKSCTPPKRRKETAAKEPSPPANPSPSRSQQTGVKEPLPVDRKIREAPLPQRQERRRTVESSDCPSIANADEEDSRRSSRRSLAVKSK